MVYAAPDSALVSACMACCVRASRMTKWLQSMILLAPQEMSRISPRSSGFCITRKRHGSNPNELGDRRADSRMKSKSSALIFLDAS